jgi:hypothetical protein
VNPVFAAGNAKIIKLPSSALPETFTRSLVSFRDPSESPRRGSPIIKQFEAKHLPSTTIKSATKYNKI